MWLHRTVAGFALFLMAVLPLHAAEAAFDAVASGRLIYLEGRLPDGSALTGTRFGTKVRGQAAACVTCHRRSGMGSTEGEELIAPITGDALFLTRGKVVVTMDPVRGKAMNQAHEPYTDASFAAAVRAGMHPSGREMNGVMPRYGMDDLSLIAVQAYLRTLSADWSPGAEQEMVHLATIVTPDVTPQRRQMFLDTLQAAVSQKNGSTMPGKRHMVMAAEFTMKTERHWDLQVWELKGKPDTWRQQLQAFYDASPVFAVLSGLGGSTWAPVHEFCEAQQLPCWFPIVDVVPEQAASSFYSIYFNRGVALEAEVLAQHLREMSKASRPTRLVQITGEAWASGQAASVLAKAMAGSGIKLETRALDANTPASVKKALAGLGPHDNVMFWLRSDEAKVLAQVAPPVGNVYFSGALGGAEKLPLTAPWKASAHLIYPYELPQLRGSNLATFRSWMGQRRMPVQDEPLQDQAYFAAYYLSDTVGEMLNNLYRDYLIERAENMLSRRESLKAEAETHERRQIRSRFANVLEAREAAASDAAPDPARAAVTAKEYLGARSGTTIFPPLGLGIGQRFASKGAYITKFANSTDAALVAETGWIVP